jgi:hypothetical protein
MPVFERPAPASAPASPSAEAPRASEAPARTSRRRPPNPYENALAKAALLIALAVVAGVWWVGAYSTLQWLSGAGVSLATVGLLAWGLPIAVTVLESGTLAARSRVPWLWLVWLVVLAFDIVTTAIGLLLVANGRTFFGQAFATTDLTSQVIAGVVGAVIALAPEPAARAIWRELWS